MRYIVLNKIKPMESLFSHCCLCLKLALAQDTDVEWLNRKLQVLFALTCKPNSGLSYKWTICNSRKIL